MLRWPSFVGCGREHVAAGFPTKGCQCLINGCQQSIGTWISQDTKLKIVDAPLILILRVGQWPCYCLFCPSKLPIHRFCITATKARLITVLTKPQIVDAPLMLSLLYCPFNICLPSTTVFIMIWTYLSSFWQIETWPWGKAKSSNIVTLFALTRLKFIYLAKSFIAPAIHLSINWYSQATAHHSRIIYL